MDADTRNAINHPATPLSPPPPDRAGSITRHASISSVNTNNRRTAARLPQSAIQILEAWLLQHRDTPYVSAQEQDQLKASTGLRRSQIKTWFANARKRNRIKALMRPDLVPTLELHAQEQDKGVASSGSPTPPSHFNISFFPHLAGLDPFERWLYLGPEHEPATVAAIQNAIKDAEKPQFQFSDFRATKSGRWRHTRSQGSWPSSLDIRSYAANKYSVTSDQWKPTSTARSVDYMPTSKPARRHRRSEPSLAGTSMGGGFGYRVGAAAQKRFQCTFCGDAFVKRHDWQRHEKSQHLALEWWTCCPEGVGTHVAPETATVTCSFCGIANPSISHLDDKHSLAQCTARSEAERTFYRKDHLRQHLRLMHAESSFTPAMESWKTELIHVRSRCGFCNVVFETWSARTNHLASHFRAGTSMATWKGDWGFEPAIAAKLERSTLPADRITSRPRQTAKVEKKSIDAEFQTPALPNMAPSASDVSGAPWDFSLLDFETIPSASVLDTFDDYSFSAASALDFFDQPLQPDFGAIPLGTPSIHEAFESPFHSFDDGSPAALGFLGPNLQLERPEQVVEGVLDMNGYPPLPDAVPYDGPMGDMMITSEMGQQAFEPHTFPGDIILAEAWADLDSMPTPAEFDQQNWDEHISLPNYHDNPDNFTPLRERNNDEIGSFPP